MITRPTLPSSPVVDTRSTRSVARSVPPSAVVQLLAASLAEVLPGSSISRSSVRE
jgi:hypothetical protein